MNRTTLGIDTERFILFCSLYIKFINISPPTKMRVLSLIFHNLVPWARIIDFLSPPPPLTHIQAGSSNINQYNTWFIKIPLTFISLATIIALILSNSRVDIVYPAVIVQIVGKRWAIKKKKREREKKAKYLHLNHSKFYFVIYINLQQKLIKKWPYHIWERMQIRDHYYCLNHSKPYSKQ